VGVAQSAMNAEKFPFFLARKCPLRHCDWRGNKTFFVTHFNISPFLCCTSSS
jgi:hypothetical protein